MAVSGALNTNNQYIKYKITIIQNSQSISDNTSNVTVRVNFYRTNTGYETYGTGTVYCKINGTTYTASIVSTQRITSSGIDLFTRTMNIPHNADGTKTLTVSAWISHSQFTATEQSFSMALTTIPRATTPVLSASSVDMGKSITITLNRASSAFTHRLSYTFGSLSGQTSGIGNASSAGTSTTFTPPLTLANQIPNATSGTLTLKCDTYNGSTLIGSKTASLVVYVPSSVVPVINTASVTEATSGIAAKFSAFVQNRSTLHVLTTAAGAYSSTITSYKVYLRDASDNNISVYTGANVTTEAVSISGTLKVVVSVSDSRGRAASYVQTFTVLAYEVPKITGFTGFRCDADGTANYEGEYVNISLNFSIAAVNDLNDKYYEVMYKVKGASSWAGSLASANIYSLNDNFITSNVFSGDNAYVIKLQLYDFFSGASVEIDIPTAFTLIDFKSNGKGIALGKVASKDGLDLADDFPFVQEDRHTPTLQSSWVNYGAAYESASYWKDKCGVVHLAGMIKSGTTTAETVIFTLPAGYRPRTSEKFFCVSANGICVIDVYSSGAVAIKTGASATWLSLSGISFRMA